MRQYSLLVSSALAVIVLWHSHLPFYVDKDTVQGFTVKEFEGVRTAFRSNFMESLERDGSTVAVYHKGELKAHLWGGMADSSSGRRWKRETVTMMFSATKAIASLCVAVLVDRGVIRYDDLVVKHWPEYGQQGKNMTTIEDVLTHKAGLPYLDERIEKEDVGTSRIREKIERATPAWAPGTASGYHAVTFGFILDELFKKVDGRDISTFFREEIASVHDLNLSIGLPKKDFHGAARVTLPGTLESIRDVIRDPRLIAMLGIMHFRIDNIIEKILATHSWINFGYDMLTLNDPEVASLPLSAVTGVGTADSVARTFALLLKGDIVSNSTLPILQRPTLDTWHIEKVVLYPVAKGHGFFYDPHPVISGAHTFGHPGYGGQMVHVDPLNDLVFVYLSNGLKTGSGDLCYPSKRLLRAVYDAIQ